MATAISQEQQTTNSETLMTENQAMEFAAANNKVIIDREFALPVAGVEAIPLGVLASVDLNGNGTSYGVESTFLETTIESTLGGVLLFSVYQALLTFLKSETARRNGEITRVQQLKTVATTALAAGKSSAFTMVLCSAIVALMPWLTWPLMALGLVGGSFMATRVAQEFWGALTEEQQNELKTAADKAKVNLEKIMPAAEPQVVAVAAAA